jgi:excisionase family DNA binding protein
MKKMATALAAPVRTLFGFAELAARWNVSKDTLRRAAEAGHMKTVYLGGRRLIPITEVTRVESEGLGRGRKRGWKKRAG